MREQMLMLDLGNDIRLRDWLLSNPVGEVFSTNTPVMGIEYHMLRTTKKGETRVAEQGFRRWPLVPDSISAANPEKA